LFLLVAFVLIDYGGNVISQDLIASLVWVGGEVRTPTFDSPYKSMQVDFYQRVTGIGITNKNLQVNAS